METKKSFNRILQEARESEAYKVEACVIEFTEAVVREMARKGLSRRELAKRLKTSPAYVTKFLSGRTNFTISSMVKVANAIGCEFHAALELPGGSGSLTWCVDVAESECQHLVYFPRRGFELTQKPGRRISCDCSSSPPEGMLLNDAADLWSRAVVEAHVVDVSAELEDGLHFDNEISAMA